MNKTEAEENGIKLECRDSVFENEDLNIGLNAAHQAHSVPLTHKGLLDEGQNPAREPPSPRSSTDDMKEMFSLPIL